MTDNDNLESSTGSGPNWAMIALIVLVIGGAIVAGILLLNDDDSDSAATSTSTATVATTVAADTTVPSTDAPATTSSPTTAAPTTAAPTTGAPSTTEPDLPQLTISIGDIDDGGTIPIEFTCDGGDERAPVVTIEASPDGVLQYAMIVDDPDAPTENPFVHWVVYGIAGNSNGFTDGDTDVTFGTNDAGTEGWFGPCPPPGDGPHEYAFTLYGLDREFTLDAGLDGRALFDEIEVAIIAEGVITASYERA